MNGDKGFFIEPTVFGSVNNDMTIAQEEIFGPVLATLTFDDIDQVAIPALNHRLVLNFAAIADGIDPRLLIERTLHGARRLRH